MKVHLEVDLSREAYNHYAKIAKSDRITIEHWLENKVCGFLFD